LGPLVQGIDGNYYGVTWSGGNSYYSNGTVFKISPAGVLTTIYNFCSLSGCVDGEGPNGGLVQAANGDFYGTTNYGGDGCGTVFKVTPAGKLTTLHSFCSRRNCEDGCSPYAGWCKAPTETFTARHSVEGG
jgi:uncharacterized repeat protein (TIGR03803 family)